MFSIASRAPQPVLFLKAMLALADLFACWLLWRLAIGLDRPPGAVAWYAWSPLVSLEVAGMGHVDALGVPLLVATWLLLVSGTARGRWASAASAAGAVLVKIVPILCLPIWARASRRPLRYGVVMGALCAGIALPTMLRHGIPSGLVRFGVSWEFNGPVYEPLWRALDVVGSTGWVESGLDWAKAAGGDHDFWNRFYPLNYARLHAKLLLLIVFAISAVGVYRIRDPVDATGRLLGLVVLVSATVYPWYLLWVLPWAALYRRHSWWVLSALIPLSYLPQITEIPLVPWVYAAIWLPFFALLLLERRKAQ